jgi:hypothetical protein
MIQTTRWSPDTCSCVIEYQWDDSVPADTRTHTPATIDKQCARHSGMWLAAHFNTLTDENPRKNKIIDAILAQLPSLVLDDITWAYDAGNVLNISSPKFTAAQKVTLQTLANTKFGAGKVLFL